MLENTLGTHTVRERRSQLARATGLLGVLLVLAGCAVGPDFKRPRTTVNQNWQAARDPRIWTQYAADSVWWKSFNDAALDRLVDLAYQQNLPLQIAGLRIAEARARLGIAVGLQFPQAQVVYGRAGAVGLSENAAPVPLPDRNFFDYEVGFDAAWEVDVWGKYRRGVQSEAATLLASVADYYFAVISLTAEVARTYALIRTFEVLVDLAQQNAKIQEEGLRIAQARFRNGATSELDVTQATTLFESTRASIPQLQISLQQARNALSSLLGQPPGAVEAMLVGPKEIPKAPSRVAVSVPAEILRRRPDIHRAELLAAAQCARIGVAKSELYPSFSLVGTVGLSASDSGGNARNLFATDSLFYTVGPQVSWPFFNYGRIKNRVRVQDALFQQSLVNYHDTVLRAAQEVEDALVGFLNAQDAALFEQRSVAAAERSNQLAMIEYREGAVEYQRVLDSQRLLLQQQNSLAQTRSSIAVNLIALYKALGGGWELRQGQPYVPERTRKEMEDRTDWGDLLSEPRAPEKQKKPPQGRR
jgi:NodT family efflux transporter outer membrane factor (OMF) lipoprotein